MAKFIAVISVLLSFPLLANAQDTLAGWSFRTGVPSELYADYGSPSNKHIAFLRATDTGGNDRFIEFKNGVYAPGDFAAMATSWDDGDGIKCWQIVFNTIGFRNLHLSARQISGDNRRGPKYFKLQYKIGNGEWTQVPDIETITVANDWVTAAITDLSLPPECDNSTDAVYLRWLMHTNENIYGDPYVWAIGSNKIDEIYITGSTVASVFSAESQPKTFAKVYPSVSSGMFNVQTSADIKDITVMNAVGNSVLTAEASRSFQMDLSSRPGGIYFVVFRDASGGYKNTAKIVISK